MAYRRRDMKTHEEYMNDDGIETSEHQKTSNTKRNQINRVRQIHTSATYHRFDAWSFFKQYRS